MRSNENQDVRPAGRSLGGGARFALFGEMLLTGAVLAVVSLPVVTAVPALAGGGLHLRRHLEGLDDSTGELLRHIARALRELWPVGVAVPALLLLLGFDWWLVSTGALPGGTAVGVVVAVVTAAICVVTLRFVGGWLPGAAAGRAIREAARRCTADVAGSVLLIAAVGVAVTVVWMLRPMLLVVPGLLALAAVAVENRRRTWVRP
ncbi:hypothetical protein [Georgenia halophila]|uniref:hypothetical protein n=1 Tax=Georgenia halophila TaxID=620889 RepID=UPI0031EC2E9E